MSEKSFECETPLHCDYHNMDEVSPQVSNVILKTQHLSNLCLGLCKEHATSSLVLISLLL